MARSDEHHRSNASALPRLYVGEIVWPCLGESQRVVLALGSFETSRPGVAQARGLELYAVGRRYLSVPILFQVDLGAGRFQLGEEYAADLMGEEPLWGRTYRGAISPDLQMLRSARGENDEPCNPDLLLVAGSTLE
jgi:hypothetical protein